MKYTKNGFRECSRNKRCVPSSNAPFHVLKEGKDGFSMESGLEFSTYTLGRSCAYTSATTIAVSVGVVLGTIFGIMRLSRTPLRYLAMGYIDFIRGTPLLVQIFIIYYGVPNLLPRLFTTGIQPYVAALVALSINSGAYVAEIVRAGIQSIEKGQTEAALSLGLSSTATMIHIILPQAFKRIIPPLGNEFIAL